MKTRHLLSVMLLLTAVITSTAFAAGSVQQPEPSLEQIQQTDNNRPHKGMKRHNPGRKENSFRKSSEEFVKFHKSENELINNLKGASKAEADEMIAGFYKTAFSKIPERKPPFTEKIIAIVSELDIPQENKTKVIAAINDSTTLKMERIKEQAINLAVTLNDLPEPMRDHALRGYNRWVSRYIMHIRTAENDRFGKNHKNFGSDRRCGNKGEGRKFHKGNRKNSERRHQNCTNFAPENGCNNDCPRDNCPRNAPEDTPPAE